MEHICGESLKALGLMPNIPTGVYSSKQVTVSAVKEPEVSNLSLASLRLVKARKP